jgi:hypothetical protein
MIAICFATVFCAWPTLLVCKDLDALRKMNTKVLIWLLEKGCLGQYFSKTSLFGSGGHLRQLEIAAYKQTVATSNMSSLVHVNQPVYRV